MRGYLQGRAGAGNRVDARLLWARRRGRGGRAFDSTRLAVFGNWCLPSPGIRPRAGANVCFYSSVVDRSARLVEELAGFGLAERLDGGASAELWRTIRDVELLGSSPKVPIWRISTRPTDAPATVATIRQSFDCRALYDWGGGLIWLAGGNGGDGGAAVVRAAVAAVGGHATLVRAARDIRAAVSVFQPLDPALMLLTKRLKQTCDPVGVLNPGRMYEGI